MQTILPIFITILVSVAIAVYPVKLAGSKLKVGQTGWLYSVVAVILSVIISTAASYLVPIIFVSIPVAIGVVGFVYESILETTLKKGICIAAIAVLIQSFVGVFLFSAFFH